MGFIPDELKEQIADAVFNNLGYPDEIRTLFLSSVHPGFRSLMKSSQQPKIQLDLDIMKLNDTQRLTDGTIPFQSWLTKAGGYLRPYPKESQLIQQALDAIDRNASGQKITNPAPSAQAVANVVKEKIIHRDDMVSFAFLEAGANAGKAVARIKVPRFEKGVMKMDRGEPVFYLGTGWIIAKDLMITNHHVFLAREDNEPDPSHQDFTAQINNSFAQFDFNADTLSGTLIKASAPLAVNKELDYVIFNLEVASDRDPLSLQATQVVIDPQHPEVVNIIQHPYGYAKKVAFRNNHIYDCRYPNIRYFTDTEGGASGAPVFNDKWEVIALHRASTLVNNVLYNGQLTAWVNEGVQLHAILSDLQQRVPEVWQRIQDAVS